MILFKAAVCPKNWACIQRGSGAISDGGLTGGQVKQHSLQDYHDKRRERLVPYVVMTTRADFGTKEDAGNMSMVNNPSSSGLLSFSIEGCNQ